MNHYSRRIALYLREIAVASALTVAAAALIASGRSANHAATAGSSAFVVLKPAR